MRLILTKNLQIDFEAIEYQVATAMRLQEGDASRNSNVLNTDLNKLSVAFHSLLMAVENTLALLVLTATNENFFSDVKRVKTRICKNHMWSGEVEQLVLIAVESYCAN